MASTRTEKSEDLSISSAIETLSTIADLEMTSTVQDPLMEGPSPDEPPVVAKTVRWLHKKNAEHMRSIVTEKLHVVLNYFKHFYQSEHERFTRREAIDGIRSIMLLVEEAAENLDRYTTLFLGAVSGSIKQTDEFIELCKFYKKNILPIAAHREVSSWIGELPFEGILTQVEGATEGWPEHVPCAPLSVEIERLKQDRDYELLTLKNPDGSRLFTPKLLRNMRLACDVEQAVKQKEGTEVEHQLELMRDQQAATEVYYLLGNSYPAVDAFFRAPNKAKAFRLFLDMYAPAVAIMNAAVRTIHKSDHPKTKSVESYFFDFRTLLNNYYHSLDFQRLLAYPPKNENSWEYAVFRLAESFASHIVNGTPISYDLVGSTKTLIQQGFSHAVNRVGDPDGTLSRDLDIDYDAIRWLVGSEGGKRLARLLEEIEQSRSDLFEPLLGQTLTTHAFDLSWRGEVIPVIRLPSPTHQEFIHKATPSEVFQIALRRKIRKACETSCLIVNLQDRTSWRDGARCEAIEHLEMSEDLAKNVHVFSLRRAGDFYEQENEYENLGLNEFKVELIEHVTEAESGALWPSDGKIRKAVSKLVEDLCAVLHPDEESVDRQDRLDMIELVYTLCILRAIAESHPDLLYISCKDGFDLSIPVMTNIYYLLTRLNGFAPSAEEVDWLRSLLFGLPLVHRERPLFLNRHHRLINFLAFVEQIFTDGKEGKQIIQAILKFLPHDIASARWLPASGHQPTYFSRRYEM